MKKYTKENLTILSLLGITTTIGALLTIPGAVASTDVVDEIAITVPSSCSISSTGGDSHTAEISNGQTNSSVGESTIKAYCNDNNGFSIYAIGYTDNELGKTVLTSSTLEQSHDILTGTNTTGNSSWAMKLSTITSPEPTYPLIIAGSTNDTDKEQGDPDYTSFQEVPDDYTLVAKRKSGTDTGTGAEGATLKTTYQVHISGTQTAGTYTGQVKYTMVHPYNGDAPQKPIIMQNLNSSNIGTYLPNVGDTVIAVDSRDNQEYTIGKLADNNYWMLDNLALDLTDDTILNGLTADNTNIDTENDPGALAALKGTSVRDPDTDSTGKYATAKVSGDWSNPDNYSAPLVNLTNKNTIPSDSISQTGNYKVGGYYNYCATSAGSYCYGNGSSYGTSSGNATSSICPKGWRLPTGGNYGEYKTLYDNVNYNTYDSYRSALHLPLSGDSLGSRGNVGFWWSSTQANDSRMYSLYLWSVGISLDEYYYRYRFYGVTIRCILDL